LPKSRQIDRIEKGDKALDLPSAHVAILRAVLRYEYVDLTGAAASLNLAPEELSRGVVRYVLSPEYADDFNQVIYALGLTPLDVLQAAQEIEPADERESILSQLRRKLPGV
jgi:hypothetical protein